jgi:pyruvate formate lyase activating enzyme
MLICGLQKLTLLDYPGRAACTVFTGGCNFRCPFCQNPALVLRPLEQPSVTEDELMGFLEKRRRVLDGVCVTGGEPTIHPDLPEFIAKIREAGYAVKLDTNGGRPGMLRLLLERGLVDYVAMDIKSSPSGYAAAVGLPDFDVGPIRESAELLLRGGFKTPFEFRTTAVKGLHTVSDFSEIGLWLEGAPRFFIQNFRASAELVGGRARAAELRPFTPPELEGLLSALRRHIPPAALRGEG